VFYEKSSQEQSHNLPHNKPFLLQNVTSWKFRIIAQYFLHPIIIAKFDDARAEKLKKSNFHNTDFL